MESWSAGWRKRGDKDLIKLSLSIRACALKRYGAQAGEGRGEGRF